MKIILDAMGGDNAPAEILKGAAAATAAWPDVESWPWATRKRSPPA